MKINGLVFHEVRRGVFAVLIGSRQYVVEQISDRRFDIYQDGRFQDEVTTIFEAADWLLEQ